MSGVDPIREYQESLRKADAARRSLSVMARTLSETGGWLQRQWQFVAVTGTAVSFPPGIFSGKQANVVNGKDWPSAESMAQAIMELHQALDDCKAKYQNIMPNDRTGLASPPEKKDMVIGPTG